MENLTRPKERVIVYIDGFNLYFGMLEGGYNEYKWLDIMELAKSCLKHNQELMSVKYFTSSIANDAGKEARQRTYIDALITKGVKIIRGKYERKEVNCTHCTHVWYRTNEKMTDVNIATTIIYDAMKNNFDVGILISGDSDLVPAINMIHQEFHPKKIAVIFPPQRHNISVANAASGSYMIGRKKLKDCQFENPVIRNDGFLLHKPKEWS